MLRELLRLMRKRVVVVANKSKKVPAGSIITHAWDLISRTFHPRSKWMPFLESVDNYSNDDVGHAKP